MARLRQIDDLKVERYALKPLRRRRTLSRNHNVIANALDRLDFHAAGLFVIDEVRKDFDKTQHRKGAYNDPEEVKRFIDLSLGIFAARKMPYSMFVFTCSFWVENIFEDRWISKSYPDVLEVDRQIDVLCDGNETTPEWTEKEHRTYKKLIKNRDEILDKKKIDTYKEFGLMMLAELLKSDPKEFENLRERGRRAMYHKDRTVPALKDIVIHFEEEAIKASKAKIYGAAVVALGSGLEGLLILRCLKSKSKAIKMAEALPKKNRPHAGYLNDPTRWTFDNLIETCLIAGWLPQIITEHAIFEGAILAHQLRLMRNNVHPGRVARETPWKEIDEHVYKDAEAIYIALSSHFLK